MPPCDTFKVVAQLHVTNDIDLDDDLSNREVATNTKGKGLVRASGTGDFAAITSSPIVFALVPFNEPDADNNPGIVDGDYNCGVATANIINQ